MCIVEGCDDLKIHAKGMCVKHYKRDWRHGDPLYKGERKGRVKNLNLKNRIIIISRKVFIINGYQNTSLRKLAEVIGVNHTHIYVYFKNKEDLFNQVFKDIPLTVDMLKGDPEALNRLK